MKYVIMADGKSSRWNNYLGIPKHLIEIDGEPIIKRTIRLLREYDPSCEIVVTSHNQDYEFPGSVRYEPHNNVLEIDRFTQELISDNTCFLYGDTYYSNDAIERIVNTETDSVLFFGNSDSIVAVKVRDSKLFRKHVDQVRQLFLKGAIDKCAGWQVYQSLLGLPFQGKVIDTHYIILKDGTMDFNEPEDYLKKIDTGSHGLDDLAKKNDLSQNSSK